MNEWNISRNNFEFIFPAVVEMEQLLRKDMQIGKAYKRSEQKAVHYLVGGQFGWSHMVSNWNFQSFDR